VPELPEVETVARQLAPLIQGRGVLSVHVYDPKLHALSRQRLAGDAVVEVRRVGKQVALRLSTDRWIAVHLRMTGRLIWRPGPARGGERAHLRLRLRLDGGSLFFFDVRRFGTVQIFADLEALEPEGLDPTSRRFTTSALTQLLQGGRGAIKPWLLRQDRLVGLGNIYCSEILFEAGIAPARPAGSLTSPEIQRLHHATRSVLRRAIRACGTTFSDFQDARGLTGSYQHYLKVYGREEAPCPTCGATVRRIEQQQRSTFFCPTCQR
jgi:formamidopyrimidine-DNA glycosylase